ncbi:hypothetical protein [Pseudobacillus badius]|uniref:hypothetical protein n=1 Tax=Bacillus badius TaxID=1455 RepID=UPI0007B37582|nr:hypothetical protein [Bacillus badius]KZR58986.1 hypothetical protein A3781_00310 [Bacillus badius]
MKEIKGVIGSQKTVPALEIGKTLVYVRTNIEPFTEIIIEDVVFFGWKYDETQFEVNEFLVHCCEKLFALEKENETLKEAVNDLRLHVNQLTEQKSSI